MIFSDLASPAEAACKSRNDRKSARFAKAGNRYPLFGIMLEPAAARPAATVYKY